VQLYLLTHVQGHSPFMLLTCLELSVNSCYLIIAVTYFLQQNQGTLPRSTENPAVNVQLSTFDAPFLSEACKLSSF